MGGICMRRLFGWGRSAAVLVILLGLFAGRASAQICTGDCVCVGDCNSDGRVTIDELIRGVVILLGAIVPPPMCDALDANHDGQIQINELILAVNNALLGCPDALTITMPVDDILVLAGT